MSPSLAEEVMPQSDGSVLVDGSANIRELNKAFDWNLPIEGPRTVNGMVLEVIGDIPQPNEQVLIGHYLIEVLQVSDNIIKQVKINPLAFNTQLPEF